MRVVVKGCNSNRGGKDYIDIYKDYMLIFEIRSLNSNPAIADACENPFVLCPIVLDLPSCAGAFEILS